MGKRVQDAERRRSEIEDELHAWETKNGEVRQTYPLDEHVQANCDRMDKAIHVMRSLVRSRRAGEIAKPDYYMHLVVEQLETTEHET